ncbi:Uncharacterized protein dnm_070170 [Desulfonema magnum]|uniref:Uncharacterized protein n=1 Tax=Desulfonema magnum TaxID=45655 RepID=A0A975BSS5_9BACT|nr:Uncharacterized protein dnm_070170 [Desulfonema magnum]
MEAFLIGKQIEKIFSILFPTTMPRSAKSFRSADMDFCHSMIRFFDPIRHPSY